MSNVKYGDHHSKPRNFTITVVSVPQTFLEHLFRETDLKVSLRFYVIKYFI